MIIIRDGGNVAVNDFLKIFASENEQKVEGRRNGHLCRYFFTIPSITKVFLFL